MVTFVANFLPLTGWLSQMWGLVIKSKSYLSSSLLPLVVTPLSAAALIDVPLVEWALNTAVSIPEWS